MTTCQDSIHQYEVTREETNSYFLTVPRDRSCLCGEYTWGWMNDKLIETESTAA